ncbi:MAG TPA: hypothetical protein VJC39_01315 [Candidatus Nanoarchaeia archaeon]|nr:hypothetical protein [Candidatus Nanoarchaeia archaeon]
MILQYLKTPLGIMVILEIFKRNKLKYILFKCDHIFEGQNKNLDILFKTTAEYHQAASILEQQGFIVRLSENIEKYKIMYCGFVNGIMYSIHLHREVAWHGMIALDKQTIFARSQEVHPLVVIPSLEDYILIHAAHVLFENFKIRTREKNYLVKFNEASADRDYILWQTRKNGWEKGFKKVLHFGGLPDKLSNQLSITEIFFFWIKKLWTEPATTFYLFKKAARIPLRKISLQRRGCLIALMGVNGSGKTTLAKKTLEKYQPLTSNLGKKQHYYYYGWEPAFFLTKLVSKLFHRNNKKLFSEVNFSKSPPKFDVFQELLFIYLFFEFYYRYLCHIRPRLQRGDLIISDRYFYDVYGQYNYSSNSIILPYLLQIFPRPDYLYVLTAEVDKLISRGKIDRNSESVKPITRHVFSSEYIIKQSQRYAELSLLLSARIIDTKNNPQNCAQNIVAETWGALVP